MTTYTVKRPDPWIEIEAALNRGGIFATNPPEPRPFSPEPCPDGIPDPLKKFFSPSAIPEQPVVDPDADPSTSPAIEPESES